MRLSQQVDHKADTTTVLRMLDLGYFFIPVIRHYFDLANATLVVDNEV
ncbi:hypothetical protein BTN49_3163 [Candidatus Enterovibrio escicola]|uniref:Uncharacterized protein n=1 Tax=Candidatus Enterovibrio escicola TaxID=1927127 RepID=A0A2A5SZE6_9GAMM|nr:hypothetical protein BTN49_3163 [Candidatus Enterovibrio escacola]